MLCSGTNINVTAIITYMCVFGSARDEYECNCDTVCCLVHQIFEYIVTPLIFTILSVSHQCCVLCVRHVITGKRTWTYSPYWTYGYQCCVLCVRHVINGKRTWTYSPYWTYGHQCCVLCLNFKTCYQWKTHMDILTTLNIWTSMLCFMFKTCYQWKTHMDILTILSEGHQCCVLCLRHVINGKKHMR